MSEAPDLAGLSPEQKRAKLAELLKRQARETTRVWPLAHGQRALWFIYRLDPSNSAYNIGFAARIRSPLNVPALVRTLEAIVARHPSLRTRFPATLGEPSQVVSQHIDLPFTRIDASAMGDAELRRAVAAHHAQAFDLEQGPAFRIALFEVADQDRILLLTLHHIVADGWSLRVLIDELHQGYAAEAAGARHRLPQLANEYRDFIDWQARMLAADRDRLRQYWTTALGGRLPVLELPTDAPRPLQQRFRGESVEFAVPPELVADLGRLARTEGVTLFTPLIAAFYALLARHSGQTDLIVGCPTLGRSRAEFEAVVGYFVNPVPLRVTLDDDPTFRVFLERVRSVVQGGLAHQDYPFPLLVEQLRPDRDASRSPVFQATFNLLGMFRGQADDATGTPLLGEPFPLPQEEGQFDVALELVEVGGRLGGTLRYDTSLFQRTTAERMVQHYLTLMAGAVASPDSHLSTLPLLTESERRHIATEWNDTATPYPPGTVADLIEATVARTPDAVAVSAENGTLTYRELDAAANRLAHHLRMLGVTVGSLVGLSLGRSTDMLVALLGILKAGGAYVPLDPAYPKARLAYMAENANLRVLVTASEFAAQWTDLPDLSLVVLDRDAMAIAARPSQRPDSGATPDRPAYVIYTSGSTGGPKGVVIPHSALVNLLCAMCRRPGIDAADTFLAVTTLSFDIAQLELLGPLVAGGRVVIASREVASDGTRLSQLIASSGTTILQGTPATWRLLLQSGWPGHADLQMQTGGEPLPRDLADALLARGGELWNMYGPTETTIYSSIERVPATGPITIGRPIANTRMYVLDKQQQLLPQGVIGELYIGGDGLAIGYHGRPDLTGERFVPDPFSPEAGARMYRTGDLARFFPDGRLDCLGRVDHQVKVRGFRIELGEVEDTLSRHPAIAQAVAAARDDSSGERRLVAYFTCSGDAPDAGALRGFMRQQLPDHMIPSLFVRLESFPLTQNGKIDRRSLPEPTSDRPSRARIAPRTVTEAHVASIWQTVLAIDDLSMEDDFFALGGHSLLATQVVARIRDVVGVDLPVRRLFEASTIAELAASVDAAVERAASDGTASDVAQGPSRQLPPIVRRAHPDRYGPLSYPQRRLWFFEQLEPGTPVFNVPVALRLVGRFDLARFERAVSRLAARHETLRTSFAAPDGDPVQVVDAEIVLPLVFRDLRSLAGADRSASISRERTTAFSTPFDPTRAPLWRAVVLQTADDEHVLMWVMHHLITDGWSLRGALRELAALYSSDADPDPLPIQYRDFAWWQTGDVGESGLADQLDYWTGQLRGPLPVLDLPTDRVRPRTQSFTGGACSSHLTPEATAALKRSAQGHHVTLFTLLLAAFQAQLARLSGQPDIIVGVPVAGRSHVVLESLIGVFINTLPIRSQVAGSTAFSDFLKELGDSVLEGFAHADVPFERIVQAVQPNRDPGRTPVFQAVFNMQPWDDGPAMRMDGLTVHPDLSTEDLSSKFDVTLYATLLEGRLRLDLVYNAELFDPKRAEEMLRQYEHLLDQVVGAPATPIAQLSLVTPGASTVLPVADMPLAFAWEGSVSDRVRHWARSHGARPAVVDPNERVTYEELNARADSIAAALRARGVGPDDRIAVLATRSATLVQTLLGIWRADAAFVIVDPAYPAPRVISYLDIARPVGVVALDTQSLAASEAEAWCEEHGAWWMPASAARAPAGTTQTAPGEGQEPGNRLAYLTFTSGTTGRPKAVMGTHAPISHFLAWQMREFGLTSDDRVSVLSGLGHDPLLRDLFSPMWVGGTAVMPDAERMLEPGYLVRWMRSERITVAHVTPALVEVLVAPRDGDGRLESLRAAFSGGERLRSSTVSALQSLAPAARIVNFYGATETPQAMAWSQVDGQDLRRGEMPIGRGISDVQLLILTEHGRLAGLGELGEIHVRTPFLSLGYFDDEVLTRERFIERPDGTHDRMYRTGDWGRYLPDGRVELCGRRDLQIKVRGFRVELGDIESTMVDHPAVADAAAVSLTDESGGVIIAAAYVPRVEQLDVPALQAFLAERLPTYMVPSLLTPLGSLPLTANRKIDRKKLMEQLRLVLRDRQATDEESPPISETERDVAAIWCELLRVPAVGAQSNFFQMGGHSLLVTRMVARLGEQLDVELPLRRVFEARTLRDLAAEIDAYRAARELTVAAPFLGDREEFDL